MSDTPISMDEFKEALPVHLRKGIGTDVMNYINSGIKDSEVLAVYRENVIGLVSVLSEGKFKITDYLNAVKYVSYRLLQNTQKAAWSRTFPDRYKKMMQDGRPAKEIDAVCSRYNSSKLVTLLMGQTMMPTHILNAPLFQDAINTQAYLMKHAKSEMVRTNAAANLLATLKPPEATKIELDVNMKEDESIKELREVTLELARQQRLGIENGSFSAQGVAESILIGSGQTVEGKVSNDR